MALAVGVNGCREAEMKVLGVAATKELRGLFAGLYTCAWRSPWVVAEMGCR